MRIRPRSRMQMHKGNDLLRWTVSFADFMTLMFAVFVVLYAVSTNTDARYKEVLQGIKNGTKLFNQQLFSSNYDGILTHNSNNIIEKMGPALLSNNDSGAPHVKASLLNIPKSGGELNALKTSLEETFSSEISHKQIKLDLNGDWLTIELGGGVFFLSGSHTLLNRSKTLLDKLAVILKPINNRLRVRGYTDNNIYSDEIYPSNWELSGARAFSVLHALQQRGIPGRRMVVEAYGEYEPIINNLGNVDKRKSRRVVIAVSKYVFAADKNDKTSVPLEREDSKKMHEIRPSANQLIMTTRQE
ncbi:MAG: OmpA family protein [Psychromonas sp.]|nr:OmpA family protein [Psychromonas sp.]